MFSSFEITWFKVLLSILGKLDNSVFNCPKFCFKLSINELLSFTIVWEFNTFCSKFVISLAIFFRFKTSVEILLFVFAAFLISLEFISWLSRALGSINLSFFTNKSLVLIKESIWDSRFFVWFWGLLLKTSFFICTNKSLVCELIAFLLSKIWGFCDCVFWLFDSTREPLLIKELNWFVKLDKFCVPLSAKDVLRFCNNETKLFIFDAWFVLDVWVFGSTNLVIKSLICLAWGEFISFIIFWIWFSSLSSPVFKPVPFWVFWAIFDSRNTPDFPNCSFKLFASRFFISFKKFSNNGLNLARLLFESIWFKSVVVDFEKEPKSLNKEEFFIIFSIVEFDLPPLFTWSNKFFNTSLAELDLFCGICWSVFVSASLSTVLRALLSFGISIFNNGLSATNIEEVYHKI